MVFQKHRDFTTTAEAAELWTTVLRSTLMQLEHQICDKVENTLRVHAVFAFRGGGMFLFFFIPLSMDHSIIHEWKRIEAQEVGVGENGLVKECFGLTSLDEAAKCNPN